jgi:hypothetical protein
VQQSRERKPRESTERGGALLGGMLARDETDALDKLVRAPTIRL